MDWSKYVWRTGLVLLATISALCTFLMLQFSYESFTAYVFHAYSQPEKLEKFRNILLTRERFALLKICISLFSGLGLLMCITLWQRHQYMVLSWRRVKLYPSQKFNQALLFWRALSPAEKYTLTGLFAVLLVLRLYFLFQVPFHIDERFTYLYFVEKGLGVSMAYYPNPNNHIFSTLLCTVVAAFTTNPWLVMKIPAFLMGLVVVGVYWALIRTFFGFTLTILATVLFACSAGVWYYGLQGRGYSLLMVCTLIAIRSIFSILKNRQENFSHFFSLWLSSILGFYTIPVFIYPFTGIVLFTGVFLLIQKRFTAFRRLGFCGIAILVSTFLLYLPVFVFNGWDAISGNSWVVPLSWDIFMNQIPGHLLSIAENMWGYLPAGHWLLLLSIIYSGIVVIFKWHSRFTRWWMTLFLTCLVSLLIFSIVQRVLLFQRLVLYLSVFQYLILSMLTIDVLSLLRLKPVYRNYAIVSICFLYLGFNTFMFYKDTAPEKFDLYDSFDTISNLLYRKQADQIFVNMYEYALCIRFQYETTGKAIYIDSQQAINGINYRYLVVHKDYPVPAQISLPEYKVIYSDAEAVVYERTKN